MVERDTGGGKLNRAGGDVDRRRLIDATASIGFHRNAGFLPPSSRLASTVMPAKAGIQPLPHAASQYWILACAGMTSAFF
jgi:hypothetical protein